MKSCFASTRWPKKAGAQRTVQGKHQQQQWIGSSKTIVGFPVLAYEEAGSVWKQEEWRQFDLEDRAVLQGMPLAVIEAIAVQIEQVKVTQIKNTVVGLGFHIPSVLLALLMLFQLQPTRAFQMPQVMKDLQEHRGYRELTRTSSTFLDFRWALAAASLGTQRSAGDSKRGLDHSLLHGVGKEQHIQASRNLQSPFSQLAPMELGLEFAVDALVIFLAWNSTMASRAGRLLHAAHEALTPLREDTEHLRSFTAKAVVNTRDVAGIAFFAALLRWPDPTQASGYLVGFKLVGEIPATGLCFSRFLV